MHRRRRKKIGALPNQPKLPAAAAVNYSAGRGGSSNSRE